MPELSVFNLKYWICGVKIYIVGITYKDYPISEMNTQTEHIKS